MQNVHRVIEWLQSFCRSVNLLLYFYKTCRTYIQSDRVSLKSQLPKKKSTKIICYFYKGIVLAIFISINIYVYMHLIKLSQKQCHLVEVIKAPLCNNCGRKSNKISNPMPMVQSNHSFSKLSRTTLENPLGFKLQTINSPKHTLLK